MVERKGIYSIEDVLSYTLFIPKKDGNKQKVCFDGEMINMASERYKTFKTKGIVCCKCGIRGTHFAMERHHPYKEGKQGIDHYYYKGERVERPYHFNLYATDKNGKEILMTKDHIIPKAKGGKNHIDNFQTMCEPCNVEKADKTC